MFLPFHPNCKISYLFACLVIKFKLGSNTVRFTDIDNGSLSDKCSAWNSLSLKFNYPDTSTLWDTIDFDIIKLNTIRICIFSLVLIRMIRIHIWQVLSLVDRWITFTKMLLQVNFIYFYLNIVHIFYSYFQLDLIISFPFTSILVNNCNLSTLF